jgi:hypothetical protein
LSISRSHAYLPKRASANANARFGINNTCHLFLNTITIIHNHDNTPDANADNNAYNKADNNEQQPVVPNTWHHHQTADVAHQQFIRTFRISSTTNDDRPPSTTNNHPAAPTTHEQ